MTNSERDLKLLKQKIDLLIDGYQVLYMKLEQQNRLLKRVEAQLPAPPESEDRAEEDQLLASAENSKVVRMSERFLARVRRTAQPPETTDWDPDEPQPS